MDTEILVAIIGAVAIVIAAIIGIFEKKEKSTNIKQNAIGKDITQTGIQNNYYSEKKGDDNA